MTAGTLSGPAHRSTARRAEALDSGTRIDGARPRESRLRRLLWRAVGCCVALGGGAFSSELVHTSRSGRQLEAALDSAASVAVRGLHDTALGEALSSWLGSAAPPASAPVAPTPVVSTPVASAPTPAPAEALPEAVHEPLVPPASELADVGDVEPAPSAELRDFGARSADPLSSDLLGGRIITGATPHRLILFTFDDGPDLRYTRGLLDTLDEVHVRAVFFLTTRRLVGNTPFARQSADVAREIVARGHHVGSHTMDHIQLPLVTGDDMLVQVDEAASLLERELGIHPALVRPPGGSRSPRVDGYLASRGYTQVLWNLGTGDYQVRDATSVVTTFRRVLERRERENGERGGIVLLHDIHAWSVEAFPRIVAWLDLQNCELLARDEELYDFVDDPALFFDARDPADAWDTAATPAELDPETLAARQALARERAERLCVDRAALEARFEGR